MYIAIENVVRSLPLTYPVSLVTTMIEMFTLIACRSRFYLSMRVCVSDGEIVALTGVLRLYNRVN